MHMREGTIDFRGFRTHYYIYGNLEAGKAPLVALHGGPGYPHYHLENLSELTRTGRAVVLYDQLGCGQSDRPSDTSLWTIDLFVAELAAIRQALHLDQIHLLGHSWGGTLAAEYLFTKPSGVRSVIFSSPLLDTALWIAETDKLKDQLLPGVAAVMRRAEKEGTTDSAEYQMAYDDFCSKFVCRKSPYPTALQRCDAEMGTEVYTTMWGPSETHVNGVLKGWTALDRLSSIATPTMFLSGKYDEATPAQIERAIQELPNATWTMFENSSHTANFEEPGNYLAAVSSFLGKHD